MHKILFICIHNSARSQMAEAFLNHFGGDKFKAESAGIEKGTLNPYVVKAMMEVGIDISKNKTKEVIDFFREGRRYDAVITVCDKEAAEKCPIFPGAVKRIEWFFHDPSKFSGTAEEILAHVREVRNEIKKSVLQFIDDASKATYWSDDQFESAKA